MVDKVALEALVRRAEEEEAAGRLEPITARGMVGIRTALEAVRMRQSGAIPVAGMPSWTGETPNAGSGYDSVSVRLAQSGLRGKERKWSLETAASHPHQREAMTVLREFLQAAKVLRAERRLPEWWVVLSSHETGTGKSYLALALAADLCRAGVGTLVVSEVEMMSQLRECQRPGSDYGIVQLRERWTRIPVLVLDDLCADKQTEFSVRELYQLVEERRRLSRPMIITSQQGSEAMTRHIGAQDADQGRRIVSRLVGMTRGGHTWLRMEGPDLRAEGEV